jgi:hypothetical protein
MESDKVPDFFQRKKRKCLFLSPESDYFMYLQAWLTYRTDRSESVDLDDLKLGK